jgi:hypothetical protein
VDEFVDLIACHSGLEESTGLSDDFAGDFSDLAHNFYLGGGRHCDRVTGSVFVFELGVTFRIICVIWSWDLARNLRTIINGSKL